MARELQIENGLIRFRQGLKRKQVPGSEVERVYMRVEESCASMCCGRVSFESCFVMLKLYSGKLLKIPVRDAKTAGDIISGLSAALPDVGTGFVRL